LFEVQYFFAVVRAPRTTATHVHCPASWRRNETVFSRSYWCTQYDWLLARYYLLSVCDAVHCGAQGRCRGLKVVPSCS